MKTRNTKPNCSRRVADRTPSRRSAQLARRTARKNYTTKDGSYRLGEWQAIQRILYHLGVLEAWKVEKLESIPGWTWDQAEVERRFAPILKSRSN